MELYQGSLPRFIMAARENKISASLSDAFLQWYGRAPGESQVRAWNNSLIRLKDVLESALDDDTGMLLEYELPLSNLRLDCMITGLSQSGIHSAEIVELKQWEACERTEEENLVVTWVDGKNRPVLHPSAQVARYQQFLKDGHSAFYGTDSIRVGSCSYLHNYRLKPSDPLLDIKFRSLIRDFPVYVATDFSKVQKRLHENVGGGKGMELLRRVRGSRIAPSKQFLRHVGRVLKGLSDYTLLDEQGVVYETVLTSTKRSLKSGTKSCIVVRGGPGTGKSVIAVNLMADLARAGFNARYATGSRAFTTTLRKIAGSRAGAQFDYTLSYAKFGENQVDVLLVDEAHRIRQTSTTRWTSKAKRTGIPQVEELLRAARVSVFFIDDLQAVRPDEIGTSSYIIEHARELAIPVTEFDLKVQFRCQGSDAFVRWLDGKLNLDPEAPLRYRSSPLFDLRIFDTPSQLESEIRTRVSEGFSARLTAGFCWHWSDPRPDGTLSEDVQIGDFKRPWNAKHDVGKLAKGIPRASLWAHDESGLNQIGCVYSAQGFEFDYVGVIVGPDLRAVAQPITLRGNPAGSEDPAIQRAGGSGAVLIARAYRILLSRGLKGCYVTFTEADAREAFEVGLLREPNQSPLLGSGSRSNAGDQLKPKS
jgi:uncharacterized protein